MSWRDFWNRDNSIYVNDRHRALHYDRVAQGIAGLVGSPDWIVLDHGCGEAASADIVAAKCARLYLYDAAPKVQERQRLRFSRDKRIVVLSADGLTDAPDASFDLVVANSLLQYVPREEFENLLDDWRRKLKPTGRLVLADIIAPDASLVGDIKALLRFAFEGGFLIAACVGLVATFFSDYRKLRAEIGLTRYSEEEMATLLAKHGFTCARAPRNIGHNQTRMMFEAIPA